MEVEVGTAVYGMAWYGAVYCGVGQVPGGSWNCMHVFISYVWKYVCMYMYVCRCTHTIRCANPVWCMYVGVPAHGGGSPHLAVESDFHARIYNYNMKILECCCHTVIPHIIHTIIIIKENTNNFRNRDKNI